MDFSVLVLVHEFNRVHLSTFQLLNWFFSHLESVVVFLLTFCLLASRSFVVIVDVCRRRCTL